MYFIQVCSDLHLERNDLKEDDFPNIISPCGEILILAGDIGDVFSEIFKKFIEYCCHHFVHVLFVSGNHEYYDYSMIEVDHYLHDFLSSFQNAVYLQNSVFEYKDILFINHQVFLSLI